jgi:uncharacterized protein (TIGR02444 family)
MPAVAAECLELQRRFDIDVNALLFCGWIGNAHRIALSDDHLAAIAACIAAWHGKVVRPLRAARQDIKPMPAMADDAVKSLRHDIARLELRAEQIEQAMLFDLAPSFSGAAAGPAAEAVRHNVSAFLQRGMPAGALAPEADNLIARATAYRAD